MSGTATPNQGKPQLLIQIKKLLSYADDPDDYPYNPFLISHNDNEVLHIILYT